MTLLRGWHIYAGLGVVVVLFAWLAWINYHHLEAELDQAALSQPYAITEIAATHLDEKFRHLTAVAIALASRDELAAAIDEGDWATAIDSLGRVPADFPYIDRIFLTDKGGTEMVDRPALVGGVGRNFSFRDWYWGVSGDWQPYISRVYQRTALPKRDLFAVAVPIRGATEKVIGILVLQVNLAKFFDWIPRLKLGEASRLYVIDGHGNLAYHPGFAGRTAIRDVSGVPAVQQLLAGKAGIGRSERALRQGEQVVAYRPVEAGWGSFSNSPPPWPSATRTAS